MTEDKKQKKVDIDIDIPGFGGLFKGIEKLVDLAGKLKEEGGEIAKEGELDLDHIKEGMKGVYGFTIKSAVGGKPKVETFGNIKKTPKGPKVEEEREPLTDIFDEEKEVMVVVEMPGIDENDIAIDLKEDILGIVAIGKRRKYRKELLLPIKTRPEDMEWKYNNGVLEIRIKK
ncbi:MAG: Hsp20/alpha crystallin family protein [Marinifilaceae bacterium]|jgi:HSP20 family protein